MLDELIVDNLGLIGHAHIRPGPGLVVVTGETGAGKTLLLGALRLLLGGPARRDLIGPAGEETTVQARFVVAGGEIAVARRIGEGRSRAYIDGLVATARALEEQTTGVVELVAQHDHLRLTRPAEVRAMVDNALDDPGGVALAGYDEAWQRFVEVRGRRDRLGGDRRTLERELDIARQEAEEIDAAGFTPGEDAELSRLAGRLRNAHGILEMLRVTADAVGEDGAEPALDTAIASLERAAGMDPTLAPLAAQAVEVATLLGELRTEVAMTADSVEADPRRLAEVEDRLALLADLRRRFGEGLDEVLAYEAAARRRADELHALLADADDLDTAMEAATAALHTAGVGLTEARHRAARSLAGTAIGHLGELGMADPVIRFDIEPAPAGPHGTDRVELRFASDSALEPAPVGRVASGGELSRLVLALRLAGGADDASVAAFDEIDAGVGGAVALALGRKLAGLATHRQVLAVTHLPQVAAYADHHLVVRRNGTETTVMPVTGDERIEELSRMLAGLPHSERGRSHAEELVAMVMRERAAAG